MAGIVMAYAGNGTCFLSVDMKQIWNLIFIGQI